MQTTDLNTCYVVNPAYKFRGDYNNVLITNNNSARYNANLYRDDITVSFAWRTHPDLAVLFSIFDGAHTLNELAAQFSAQQGTTEESFIESVSPCICNEEPILIPAYGQQWVSIPKNFLIPNTEKIFRKGMLEGVDIPFVRQHYDLSEVRLHIPNNMTLMLNTECVTDCIYCYADKPYIKHPLPFPRIQALLREASDLGMSDVDVDGGDFFLYPYWRELLMEMRKYDYLPTISTKCPMSESMVEDLKYLGVKKIQLSIDSVDSMEMQKMLYVDEFYTDEVLYGLQLLDEADIEITVKPVITKFNDSEESLNNTIDMLTSFANVRQINFTPADFSQFKSGRAYFSTRAQLARLKTIVEERNKTCSAKLSFLGYAEPQTEEQRRESFPHRSLCSGNVHGFFVLPDGKVTFCEQMYWHPFFILGDLTRQSIMEMWNSDLALARWNFSQDEVRDVSPCKTCEEFEKCHRGLGNCWRMAISAYGYENYDFPAPNCPKAPPIMKDFYIQ